MRPEAHVELPGGWLDPAGVCRRDAVIRPLRGHDEEWLHGLPPGTPLVGVVTELLLRCLGRLGPSPPTPEVVRLLPVGDRDYLVLRLHQLSFGDRMELTLACPRPGCRAELDADFQLGAIPVREAPQRPGYPLEHDGRELRFRLPRGDDLEELDAAGGDPGMVLLERCLLGGPDDVAALRRSPALRAAVEAEMERRSPGVERELEAVCPECRQLFGVDFDPVGRFFAEVGRRRPEFDRDVHLLSYHYHWPLSEILGMARPRRQAYVALLLDRLGSAAVAAAG
jgi:hypothetical protein